jgi:hypothetical protein
MRRPARKVVLLVLSVTGLMSGQSVVSGVVSERAGDHLVPAVGISVFASQNDRGNVAVAETDQEGRYVLRGLREGRYTIFVDRRALVSQVNGRRTDRVDVTCPDAGEWGPVEFELVRGGAVEGYVVDIFGEPLQGVHLGLRQPNSAREDGQGEFGGSGDSDNRGYFRIWRVRPGDYVLAAGPLQTNNDRSRYIAAPVGIKLHAGEEVTGVQIVMDLSQLYSVSGRVTDLPDDGTRHEIRAHDAEQREGTFPLSRSVDAQGRFHLTGLPAGSYILRLLTWEGNDGSEAEQENLLLGRLDVRGDMEGVVLRPLPATGVRGRLMLEGFEEEGDTRPPEHFAIGLRPIDGSPPLWVSARAPAFEFERRDIPPGEYEIEQRLHVPYLRMPDSSDGGRILVRVAEGRMETVNLVLSARGGKVTGRVWSRASADEDPMPASHYRVGLRSTHGGSVSVMADQDGRFDFGSVAPGDYAIWAWRDLRETEARDPKVWEQAGDGVRRITVEKEMHVEVELTVTP